MADPARTVRKAVLVSMRLTTGVLAVGLFVVAALMLLVWSGSLADPVPWVQLAFVSVAAVSALWVNERFCYEFTPLVENHGTAALTSVRRFGEQWIVRVSISLVAPILTLVLPFLRPGGAYVLLLGLVLSEVVLIRSCWPTERAIARAEHSLESAGVDSHLREGLGLPVPAVPVSSAGRLPASR